MSTTNAINRLLSIAAKEIGGYYPGESKYGVWYAERVGSSIYRSSAYCAMFVSWCANEAGLLGDVIPLHAYTPAGANWFRSKGQFTKGVKGIRRGDIWYSSCAGLGRISHVGIVERVYADGSFDTIEGNTSITSAGSQTNGRRVARKRRNSACSLGGYARPAYPSDTGTTTQVEKPAAKGNDRDLAIQHLLKAMGFYDGALDGIRGPMQIAATKVYQEHQNKYGAAGLVPDGDWALKTHAWYEWVVVAQTSLNKFRAVLGRVSIDGNYGPSFHDQVERVQKENGLYPDGLLQSKTITFMRSVGSSIPNRPKI